MKDIADFARSSAARIESVAPFTHPKPLLITLQDTGQFLGSTRDRPNYYELLLPRDPGGDGVSPYQGVADLHTMAHELGHVIHFSYGLDSPGELRIAQAIDEGFADAFHLRYLRHRELRSVTYDSLTPVDSYNWGNAIRRRYTVSPMVLDGLETPRHDWIVAGGLLQTSGAFGGAVYSEHSARTPCGGLGATTTTVNPYDCGALIPTVYWELMNNVQRVSSGASSAGASILYSYDAELAADEALVFAISSISSGATLPGLFDQVRTYYSLLFSDGKISSAELNAVEALLRRYCVTTAYAADCRNGVKLPGHLLPRRFLRRSVFGDPAHTAARWSPGALPIQYSPSPRREHLVLPHEYTLSGFAALHPHPYDPSESYANLQVVGDSLEFDVSLPSNSRYSVRVAVGPTAAGSVLVSTVPVWTPATPSQVVFSSRPQDPVSDYRWVEFEGVANTGVTTFTVELASGANVRVDAIHITELDCAVDSDSDGVCDADDRCSGGDDAILDPDIDGLCGVSDLCPAVADSTNADSDGDGVGDVCDECPGLAPPYSPGVGADPDGDRICNANDNCDYHWNRSQSDLDGDGKGDVCDDDSDGDGDNDEDNQDNCPGVWNPDQDDADGDGVGDACDCDSGDALRSIPVACIDDGRLIDDRFRGLAEYLHDKGVATPWLPWDTLARCPGSPCLLTATTPHYADASARFVEVSRYDSFTVALVADFIAEDSNIESSWETIAQYVEFRVSQDDSFFSPPY